MKHLSNNQRVNRSFHLVTRKALSLIAFFAAALSFNASADITETIERQFAFDSNGRIQLSNVNGNVTFTACSCDQVSLTAKIIASSQETRDRISIEIDESRDNLRIKTRYKDNHNNSRNHGYSEVIYTLSVPNDVRLDDINLVNGDLDIRGVTGELHADLVNGQLYSDGLTATTRVNMVNGNMDIRFGNLANASRVTLESVNGNINLYLPSGSNATIDAETVSGRISNDFGMEVIKHRFVGSSMKGTIGSGSARIDLENVNGRIAVNSL
jgi:hypothetical protein